jgi:hypothetical protein
MSKAAWKRCEDPQREIIELLCSRMGTGKVPLIFLSPLAAAA